MRISGGSAKGRRIGFRKTSEGNKPESFRPTSSKVREAVFDILRDKAIGTRFLDLYAGTGAVGMEALSRGAARVVFVEENPVRADAIKETLVRIGFKDALAVRARAVNFINTTHETFDIIFLDPPYASGELEIALPLLAGGDILKDKGIVIAEHSTKKILPPETGSLGLKKIYKYGDTSLSVYNKNRQ